MIDAKKKEIAKIIIKDLINSADHFRDIEYEQYLMKVFTDLHAFPPSLDTMQICYDIADQINLSVIRDNLKKSFQV